VRRRAGPRRLCYLLALTHTRTHTRPCCSVKVTNVCPGPVESEITLHSFTDTPGEEMGVRDDGSKRMSAERCAQLMVAATHAGLEEVWLAPQPILFFVYVGQYLRPLYFYLGPILGQQRVQGWLSGVKGYNSLSVAAALGGGKAGKGKAA
jgi:dehydrogenase/reductase SDR family protein 7